jgi:hypothetical protein
MNGHFRRSCHSQPPCDVQALFVRNEEVRGSTPLGSTSGNPDRMGLFCTSGASLPDEFWGNSSSNSSSSHTDSALRSAQSRCTRLQKPVPARVLNPTRLRAHYERHCRPSAVKSATLMQNPITTLHGHKPGLGPSLPSRLAAGSAKTDVVRLVARSGRRRCIESIGGLQRQPNVRVDRQSRSPPFRSIHDPRRPGDIQLEYGCHFFKAHVRCSRRSRQQCCGAVIRAFDPQPTSAVRFCCDAQHGS